MQIFMSFTSFTATKKPVVGRAKDAFVALLALLPGHPWWVCQTWQGGACHGGSSWYCRSFGSWSKWVQLLEPLSQDLGKTNGKNPQTEKGWKLTQSTLRIHEAKIKTSSCWCRTDLCPLRNTTTTLGGRTGFEWSLVWRKEDHSHRQVCHLCFELKSGIRFTFALPPLVLHFERWLRVWWNFSMCSLMYSLESFCTQQLTTTTIVPFLK